MDIKAELTRKAGPLPIWGWAAIGGVGVFLLLRMKKSGASNTTNNNGQGANTANPASFAPGSDSGGGGGGGGIIYYGLQPPTAAPPTTTPPAAPITPPQLYAPPVQPVGPARGPVVMTLGGGNPGVPSGDNYQGYGQWLMLHSQTPTPVPQSASHLPPNTPVTIGQLSGTV